MSTANGIYELDKNIPIPLYYQLKQCIVKAIQGNTLQVGDAIPTEVEFCEQLGISRPTIRQALSELVVEGYLNRLKGKGTFVSKPKIDDRFLQKLESFNHEMLQKGLIPSTKVLGLEVIADTSLINEKLDLPFDDKLLFLTRLRFANNDPIVFLETYIPYSKFPELLDQDYVNNSLYSLMEAKSNIRVDRVSRQIEAVNPTTREAKNLQMQKGQAICLVKTIAYSDKGVPVEYSIARYRGDKNKFSIELYR